jgi:PAS domain S-box-containing protein
MMASFIDITDRAIAFFDLEGNLTYVNDAGLKLWGYDDNEVVEKKFVELWQNEARALNLFKVLSGQIRWLGELVAIRKDGSNLDVHLSASTLTDDSGKPISMMISFVDITERKRVEEEVNDLKSGPTAIQNFNQIIIDNLPIRTVGINFGAPGDRMADNGTLWLEYPRVGGPSPDIPVSINPEELLFSIDSTFQTELDKKNISEELRREFENKRVSLSQSATVAIEKKESEWLITRDDRKRYSLRKEADQINIYHGTYEQFQRHSSRIQVEPDSEPAPTWVVASGLKGVSSVTITLAGKPNVAISPNEGPIPKRPYNVRLYFAEPDEIMPGQRIFSVAMQGQTVLRNFDIVKEAGGPNRPVIKEFKNILVKKDLTMAFTPSNYANPNTPMTYSTNVPLICGIEIVTSDSQIR